MAASIMCLLSRSWDKVFCPLSREKGYVRPQCSLEKMSLLLVLISSLPDAVTEVARERRASYRGERDGKDSILAREQ